MKLSLSTHAFVLLLSSLGGVVSVLACANDDNPSAPITESPDAHITIAPDSSEASSGDAACDECAAPVDCKTADFCGVALPVPSFVALNAVWGSSSTDLWLVGSHGTILHGDGTTFSAVSTSSADAGVKDDTFFFSVWGSGRDDVWVGPARAPLHYAPATDGGAPTWQVAEGTGFQDLPFDQARVAAIWGSAKSNVWIAGPASMRFGGSFGSLWSASQAKNILSWNAVDAYQGDDITNPSIRALWGADASNIFAVADLGKAFRYVPAVGRTAARWNAIETYTTAPLDGVWGSSATDVWAVGTEGIIRHFTGDVSSGFVSVGSPTTRSLHGVWGSSATDVWAVGEHATILHYDGKTWTEEPTGLATGQTPALFGIWGSGPDDIWITGEGTLLHRIATNRRLP